MEYILCVELRLNSILSAIGSGGFVSSGCLFLDKKTLLQIGLNHGLNVIISPGTGPIQPLPCQGLCNNYQEGGGGLKN